VWLGKKLYAREFLQLRAGIRWRREPEGLRNGSKREGARLASPWLQGRWRVQWIPTI
jgi:hypothetical protein